MLYFETNRQRKWRQSKRRNRIPIPIVLQERKKQKRLTPRPRRASQQYEMEQKMLLDLSNPKDAHIDERLRATPLIWLATVRPDGRPHLVPVGFVWDGETITIYSEPNTQKSRNIQQNPNVTVAKTRYSATITHYRANTF